MKARSKVAIVGYGAYIPAFRLKVEEVARLWGKDGNGLATSEIAVACHDEDAVTIATEAARYALASSKVDPSEIGAVYVGSESKPYAVKPCGTIVAAALGLPPNIVTADVEFACKAGTEALQVCMGLVSSGMVKYGLAIGVDTAQSLPSDDLEYTASCGGAAYLVGPASQDAIAIVEASTSYVTDTPDFWRRAEQCYPRHAERFTGKPSYFKHIVSAAKALMKELGTKPEDYTYAVFHQPNAKFPIKVGLMLGFSEKQLKPGYLAPFIGNTYAGNSLLSLAAVLDVAKPGDRILVVSYGSGAGSDAFSLLVQNTPSHGNPAPLVSQLVERKKYVDYALYAKFRGKIKF
ncbi:hydroxymethylglutaryl-CoA synthase [Candidatus Bathyarchaeota archaeon]|nr:MAG: hydroxymethylglutaryl-CoA synthase [Candidatus Hecatellales archaeon]RLI34120.1 MAG: hydroxymethylglutaryl-CoA synthase [Candidatus Bathyarchaeota archaeon]